MGLGRAEGLAAAVEEGLITLDVALGDHLTTNHYPPVSRAFIPIAKQAIALASNGDRGTVLDMPNGKSLTVAQIVEGLHLEPFAQRA